MELEMAKEICNQYDGRAYVSITIEKDGKAIVTNISFWNITKKQMKDAITRFNLGILKKEFKMGDIDLTGDNFKFNEFGKCKITGYKTETIPAKEIKTAIYDCNGNNKT